MVFSDNQTRAGFFDKNVFQKSLKKKEEIEPYRKILSADCMQLMEDFLIKGTKFSAPLDTLPEEQQIPSAENEDISFVTQTVQRIKKQAHKAQEVAYQTDLELKELQKQNQELGEINLDQTAILPPQLGMN